MIELHDDRDEFYVTIPLRNYWELAHSGIKEKIIESIQHYAWVDDFHYMMDIEEGKTPEKNKCLANLDFIESWFSKETSL